MQARLRLAAATAGSDTTGLPADPGGGRDYLTMNEMRVSIFIDYFNKAVQEDQRRQPGS